MYSFTNLQCSAKGFLGFQFPDIQPASCLPLLSLETLAFVAGFYKGAGEGAVVHIGMPEEPPLWAVCITDFKQVKILDGLTQHLWSPPYIGGNKVK